MPTQQTGWVTNDQHFFQTQTEAEAYERLQKHFENQIPNTVDYDYKNGFETHDTYTRTIVAVTPSLVITLTSFEYIINADCLPKDFIVTREYIQKASYQATSVENALTMFDYLQEHITRFINF